MNSNISIDTLEELNNFARSVASKITVGEVKIVCLKGDLGSGKTTFAQCLINELTKPEKYEVTSPTFNLVHTYNSNFGPSIWHFDLYRLKSLDEVYELGIEDALREIVIIEWPEIAESILPKHNLTLNFSLNKDGARIITIG